MGLTQVSNKAFYARGGPASIHTCTKHRSSPAAQLQSLPLRLPSPPSPVQQLAARDQLCDNVHLAARDVHGIQLDAVGVVHLRAKVGTYKGRAYWFSVAAHRVKRWLLGVATASACTSSVLVVIYGAAAAGCKLHKNVNNKHTPCTELGSPAPGCCRPLHSATCPPPACTTVREARPSTQTSGCDNNMRRFSAMSSGCDWLLYNCCS